MAGGQESFTPRAGKVPRFCDVSILLVKLLLAKLIVRLVERLLRTLIVFNDTPALRDGRSANGRCCSSS